ncbi:CHAT domain-containing protein [Halodesulfovibrio aestuarii]|uniref:CHAT domain-containing protein n=1 Tax=Halodesulfovibrio aestuarii TaxID=126333 RepID=UPI003D348464
MSKITSTLNHHSQLHNETISALEKLTELPEKITVLFFAANPVDQSQLRLDEEVRAIDNMIRASKHRDAVKLVSRWAVRPTDIFQAINEHTPTIIHFSGHGSNCDEIIFQDERGMAKAVSKKAIVEVMMASGCNIRLVFFNTCYSRNQAEAVVDFVEAAIGMNTSIGDDAARIFAAAFYSALGFAHSVPLAFQQAKATLLLENIPEENTPELFIKSGCEANALIIVRPSSTEDALVS